MPKVLAFAGLAIPAAGIGLPLAVFLSPFYAEHMGLGMAATGTVFIKRDPSQARQQTQVFQDRLLAGHRLLFFPEGTSTDGQRVLPFKPTLFQAFFAPGLRDEISIQPVSVIYHAPPGEEPRFYG